MNQLVRPLTTRPTGQQAMEDRAGNDDMRECADCRLLKSQLFR